MKRNELDYEDNIHPTKNNVLVPIHSDLIEYCKTNPKPPDPKAPWLTPEQRALIKKAKQLAKERGEAWN